MCLRIWSRETGSAVSSRVSLLISILRPNLVLTYGIPLEFRGGVYLNRHTPTGQSRISGHANAYRWRSLPRVRRHRTSKPQGSSERVLPYLASHHVCVCVFSSHSFWTSMDVPAGVTQEEGHTGGRSHRISHPPSFCGACLIFLARRNQPFLSLVDREDEFCVLTI